MTNWRRSGSCSPRTPPPSRAAGSGMWCWRFTVLCRESAMDCWSCFLQPGWWKPVLPLPIWNVRKWRWNFFSDLCWPKLRWDIVWPWCWPSFPSSRAWCPPLSPNPVCREAAELRCPRKSSTKSMMWASGKVFPSGWWHCWEVCSLRCCPLWWS